MIPTPILDHFTYKDYEKIYEPSEDSFLFMDTLEEEKSILEKLNPAVCVEIGYVTREVKSSISLSDHKR